MATTPAIHVRQLSKTYDVPVREGGLAAAFKSLIRRETRPVDAVKSIGFEVAPGEMVGFLGPNGAGKTTTIRMVTCFSPITGGTIRVFGQDVAKEPRTVKALMGICPQEDNLDPDFSVRKNLLVFARYFGPELK